MMLRRGSEAPQVADLGHDRGGRQQVHSAQGHQPFDHRTEHRFGCRALYVFVERFDALGHRLDRIHIFLEHDLLHRMVEPHRFHPAIVRLRPVALAVIALAMPQQKRQQALLGLSLQMLDVFARTRQIAQRFLRAIRHPYRRQFFRPPDAALPTSSCRAGRS